MNLKLKIHSANLILLISVLLIAFYNVAFFRNTVTVYPLNFDNILFISSLALVLVASLDVLFSLVCWGRTLKPILVLTLVVSAFASYYMNSYNIIIDKDLIRNIIYTDRNEVKDLFSLKLVFYFLILGALPSILIYKTQIEKLSIKKEIISRLKNLLIIVLTLSPIFIISAKHYPSFVREHKPLRYYSNPIGYLYAITKFFSQVELFNPEDFKLIGESAFIPKNHPGRELVIFIVGETVRADRFSLNGYERKTNPLLEREDIINFSNMQSCGTSTVVSVPCMFSIYGKKEYSHSKAANTENILDLLSNVGVSVLWRDNNSDSKGVATRLPFEDFRSEKTNPSCDSECRDVGMLSGLQEYIDSKNEGDILIVLHQMGNHGPAYYKRYPVAFEYFKPACKTNQLESCTSEEIDNAYDNAILYTDYFLSKVINFLKPNSDKFETAMFYVSDHGESLGEGGLYLHGLPEMVAPKSQTHVASLMWFGDNFMINKEIVKRKANTPLSHDNVFHTLLGVMEVNDASYKKDLDILSGAYYE